MPYYWFVCYLLIVRCLFVHSLENQSKNTQFPHTATNLSVESGVELVSKLSEYTGLKVNVSSDTAPEADLFDSNDIELHTTDTPASSSSSSSTAKHRQLKQQQQQHHQIQEQKARLGRLYFNEDKLVSWRDIAHVFADSISAARHQLQGLVRQFHLDMASSLCGRMLAHVLHAERVGDMLRVCDVTMEALAALQSEPSATVPALPFVVAFFQKVIDPSVERPSRMKMKQQRRQDEEAQQQQQQYYDMYGDVDDEDVAPFKTEEELEKWWAGQEALTDEMVAGELDVAAKRARLIKRFMAAEARFTQVLHSVEVCVCVRVCVCVCVLVALFCCVFQWIFFHLLTAFSFLFRAC